LAGEFRSGAGGRRLSRAAAGYRVLLPDNRDVGRSFRVEGKPPGKWQQFRGQVPDAPYALEDMAQDTAQWLAQLGIGLAHVIGMSMGGMIAQCLAAQEADKIRSLTSIFSTTGARRVGQPALSTLLRMARPAARDLPSAQRRHVAMMRHIGDASVPGIEQHWQGYTEEAWARNGHDANAGGVGRQIGAIFRSGDRSALLARIQSETLVIHGAQDRMVHPSGGLATARAIPSAQFLSVPRLRHQLDEARTPELIEPILALLQRNAR
jgi:pimeloyl-ACP methyl ester carboxylesterase